MAAPKPISNLDRSRLNAPQIGEGIWAVFDTGGACIIQLVTSRNDVNGLVAASAATGGGPLITVQGADTNIDLGIAALGTGVVHLFSPVIVSGTLEVLGATTLDSTLHVLGAVTFDTTLLVKGATTLQASLTQTGGTASFDSPTLVVDETNHRVQAGVAVGTGTHKVLIANSAPSGATLTAALLGIYSSATPNVMLRETTNNLETYWQATGAGGATFGTLTVHALSLVTSNATRISVASGGNVTFGATALFVDETNNRVGVANAGPTVALDVTGDTQLTGILYHSSVGASLIIPSAAGWVVLNHAAGSNNLAVSDLGAVTTRSTLTVLLGGANITGATTVTGSLHVTTTSALDGLVTAGAGVTLSGGDLTLFNAQIKKGTDTWLLPALGGSDTVVVLALAQTLTNKTLGSGTKVLLGGDATGDLYYNSGSGTLARLGAGTTAQVLLGQGAGVAPSYGQVDRTRVVLTTATGIMTLHDAQTKDAAQVFSAQLTAGPSGTGSHQLVCASSAPSGATFTSAQIGVYGSTVANVMLREMSDSVEAYWQGTSGGVTFGSLTSHLLQFVTGNSIRLVVSNLGSVIIGSTAGALGTGATDGFLYIPTCPGPPTGIPTAVTGTVPLVYDTTNNFLYIRNGGGWKKSTVYA